jgi:ABC-type sugar transport system ATPase subunit
MEELMGMSDRMVILSKGRQTGILRKEEFSQEKILKYFAEVAADEIQG